jgi:hypothetical protein
MAVTDLRTPRDRHEALLAANAALAERVARPVARPGGSEP